MYFGDWVLLIYTSATSNFYLFVCSEFLSLKKSSKWSHIFILSILKSCVVLSNFKLLIWIVNFDIFIRLSSMILRYSWFKDLSFMKKYVIRMIEIIFKTTAARPICTLCILPSSNNDMSIKSFLQFTEATSSGDVIPYLKILSKHLSLIKS